ncbi:hypothetical protein [Frigoribacterium sp. PvP032]|uniref:hypothetical protein n=1 Tax=Frigoribacterium sp. PvP032 TaxID=2806589 RepID=UPI001AE56790|nr:hypothetical protein [Frigoribacterium sp. PvP032]MBP1189237.1 hypothetical protein [Frigoribacterium sp. PvP032]
MRAGGRERVAKRVTVVAVAALVAGVVAVGIPANAAWTLPDLPEKDQASWTMPLDQYVGVGVVRLNYATELLIQDCMVDAGHDDAIVPWRDVDAATNATERQPLRAFDLAAARARGYHVPPTVDAGADAWRAFEYRETSPDEAADRSTCLDRAYRQHPELLTGASASSSTGSVGDIAIRLSNAAFLEARQDSSVRRAADAWHACMLDQGVGAGPWADDLPDDPADMPTTRMAETFTSYDPATAVSDEERDLAETDAACRAASGYLDALYEAEWQQQLTVPHDYGERLAQIDTGPLVAAQQLVDRTIEQLGPERPKGL